MPRRIKAPRLHLRLRRSPRGHVWEIRDETLRISTGCGEHDTQRRTKLSPVTSRRSTGRLVRLPRTKLLIDEVMAAYLKDFAQNSPSREFSSPPRGQPCSGGRARSLRMSTEGTAEWRTRQMYRARAMSAHTSRHDLVGRAHVVNLPCHWRATFRCLHTSERSRRSMFHRS